ncbi:hypothetical protein ScPMuIL_001704 [Solemya velum]
MKHIFFQTQHPAKWDDSYVLTYSGCRGSIPELQQKSVVMATKSWAYLSIVLLFALGFILYGISKHSRTLYQKSSEQVNHLLHLAAREKRTSFDTVANNFNRIVQAETQEHIFNCTNIHHILIQDRLGTGKSKQGFLGEYKGSSVVVKMATSQQKEVKECMDKIGGLRAEVMLRKRCHGFPHMKMLKEILLHHELMHHSIARLLGYCVRSEELDSLDLTEHGVISVYEYGENFTDTNLTLRPWPERLRYAVGLAAFIRYLESSPLGSVRYTEFRLSHFRLIAQDIKVIDISSFVNSEYNCDLNNNCPYGIICKRGICPGYNAKYNMDMFYKQFFSRVIMKGPIPDAIKKKLEKLSENIQNLKINENELVAALLELA